MTKRVDRFESATPSMTPMLPEAKSDPMLPLIEDSKPSPPTDLYGLGQAGSLCTPSTGDYDSIVIEAVDKSLGVLGEQGKQAILGLLESRYGLCIEDVPEYPRSFIGLLALYLGPTAYIIERQIVSDIRRAVVVEGQSLPDVVSSLEGESPLLYVQA